MAIRTRLQLIAWLSVTLVVLLVAGGYFNVHSLEQVGQAHETRYRYQVLADELRLHVDELTRLARTYVVTGEQRFEDAYWEHKGQRGVAEGMLSLNEPDLRSRLTEDERTGLQRVAAAAAITARTEAFAMSAIKSVYEDWRSDRRRHGETTREMALRLLFDADYHAAKQRIMHALKEFETHLAQRTQRLVDSYETSVRRYQITSWVVLVLAALGITLVVGQTVARISRSVDGLCDALQDHSEAIEHGRLDARMVTPGIDVRDFAPITPAINRMADSFGSIIDHMPVSMVVIDRRYQVLYANDSACSLVGAEPGELTGRHAYAYMDREQFEDPAFITRRTFQTASTQQEEVLFHTKSGELLSVLMTQAPICDAEGRVVAVVEFAVDQTSMRRVQADVSRNEERLRLALECSNVGLWDHDIATGEVFYSDTWLEMLGYERGEVEPTIVGFRDLIHPADRQQVREGAIAHLHGRADDYQAEFRFRASDGSYRWIISRGRVIHRDAYGFPARMLGTHVDITMRKEAEEHLRISEQRFVNMSANVPGMIFTIECDDAGSWHIPYASAGCSELFAASPRELVDPQRDLIDRFLPEDRESIRSGLRASLRDLRPWRFEARVPGDGDDPRWLRGSGRPERLPGGRTRWDGVIVDVNEEKHAEAALREAKQAAEASDRAKTEFIANMSHEVRTPMNSVIVLSDILRGALPAGRDRERAALIHSAAKSLLVVINDVLDLARLESGRMQLLDEPFDIRRCCREVVDLLAGQGENDPVQLRLDMHAELAPAYRGDQQRVRQILTNVVGNARKFTERGSVDLAVSPQVAGNDARLLRIMITDTGIGMTPEQTAVIFDKFVQADTTIERRYGGTGLGLSITRELVEHMGGSIRVCSALGEGSRFVIDLPLPHADLPVTAGDQGRPAMAAMEGRRVLLVEDHELNRIVAQDLLADYQLQVDVATDGYEAVTRYLIANEEEQQYDLVLMDIQMPGLNGFQATAELRRHGCQVPVVALTAGVSSSEQSQCLAAGMADVLAKPILRPELETILQRYLLGDDEAVVDVAQACRRFGDDETELLRYLPLWLDGLEADRARLLKACEDWDLDAVGRLAHTLRSHGRYLGSDAMVSQCRTLERLARSHASEPLDETADEDEHSCRDLIDAVRTTAEQVHLHWTTTLSQVGASSANVTPAHIPLPGDREEFAAPLGERRHGRPNGRAVASDPTRFHSEEQP